MHEDAATNDSKPWTLSDFLLVSTCPWHNHAIRVTPVTHDSVPGGRSELGHIRLAQQRVAEAEKCMRAAAQLQAAAPVLPFSELPRVFC